MLHTVTYDDDGTERPVLYRASVCEMVVPYGDPGEQYYRKNAFDIGEYGIGTLANSLALGCDCLGADPLLRRPHARQPRQGRHAQERRLPARGGRRPALEAHRLADQPVGGAAVAAAVGVVHRHGRQLRVRLLLALLPGRLDPVRGQADRHHEHDGPEAEAEVGLRRGGRPAAERAVPPAHLRRPARHERGRRRRTRSTR